MPYRGSRAPLVVAYIVTFFGACAVKTNSTGERLFDPYAVDQETDQSSASASPDGTNGSTPGGGKAPNGGGNTDSSADPSAGGDPSANDAGPGSETDAGLVPMPPPELDDPIFTGDVVCSSNSFWRDGNEGSERMRPGYACNDCHRDEDEEEAPIYSIAGTLYKTGHEPDDCDGVRGEAGAIIEIVDSAGKVARLEPNAAGNFFSTERFSFPVQARVLSGGQERIMEGEITAPDGDCNLCHTQDGTEDAPGRIALP